MQNPASTAWDLRITQADYNRLRAGLEDADATDNSPWRVTSEMHLRSHNVGRPHRGTHGGAPGGPQPGPFPGVPVSPALMVVRVARRDNGNEQFVLGVRPVAGDKKDNDKDNDGGSTTIEAITWDQHSDSDAEQTLSEEKAKSEVTRLLREELKCDLEGV